MSPGRFKIYASNVSSDWNSTTSTSWNLIHNQTSDLSFTYLQYTDLLSSTISSVKIPYRYYAIVVTNILGASGGYLLIAELQIFGKEPIQPQPIAINTDFEYISFPNTGQNQTQYSITFPEATECDILVVGGGGGGGFSIAGGAGAGGLIFNQNVFLNGTYTINVGRGGLRAPTQGNSLSENGRNSTFIGGNNSISYNAIGGAGTVGQSYQYNNMSYIPANGGSGGGGVRHSSRVGLGTAGQGNNGGSVSGGYNNGIWGGGGGGGAGAVGGILNPTTGGIGGIGRDMSSTFGTSVGHDGWFAGGGGGGVQGVEAGIGGKGGGGKGGKNNIIPATSGINGTGGGGGGGEGGGGNGGSGIVIIRYRSSISNDELKKRSETHVKTRNILTNNFNNDSFTFGNEKYPSQIIEPYILTKIIVTSIIFLESNKEYKLNINLGIATENTIYYVSKFIIEGITVNETIYTYDFKTSDGGFYKFSFIAVVLLKKNTTVGFNVNNSSTDKFNYINYLYGGSTLNNNIAIHNITFKSVLYTDNTQESLSRIIDVLHSQHDYWDIRRMNSNINSIITERNKLGDNIDEKNRNKNNAYDDVIKLIRDRDFTGKRSGKDNWFNTANPTLNQNVSPSLIFKDYNDINYITYEKIGGKTDTTPTIDRNVGVVGSDFITNFNKTDNSINTATIYVLR
jgi:hypothetical protein